MKLLLIGHEDRYAVEQLQLALFPLEPMEPMTESFEGDGAVSRLIRSWAPWVPGGTAPAAAAPPHSGLRDR